jgi:hypothetical protein
MALTDARNLALMKAALTLIAPRCHVAVDPGGTMTDQAALDVLTAEVVEAESALDNDQRPALRVVMNAPYLYGHCRLAVQALVDRITVVNP